MHVVITGADGFIGRNLRVRLAESAGHEVTNVTRASPPGALAEAVRSADLVFHLAGVNRPPDPADFEAGNAGYTDPASGVACMPFPRTQIVGGESGLLFDMSYPTGMKDA